MTDERLPLSGIRVLSFEQYGAGPFGTLHLADLGAEIIKVEDPAVDGDIGRSIPPFVHDGDSLFFQSLNRNKRSVLLDVESEVGRRAFHDLVRHCDAVFSNLRGDVPDRLGLTYRQLAPINPRIVCCSLSGFGMNGPRRVEPAYDYVLQAMCGWMSLTGEPDAPPTKSGLSLVDFTSGIAAALALVTGICSAKETGVGTDCDVSLYDTAMSMLNYLATWHLSAGYEPQRTRNSSHPTLAPFQCFATSDSWIVIACPTQKFWQRLTVALEAEWAFDGRFADVASRSQHKAELVPLIEKKLKAKTTDEWEAHFLAHGVPCAAVRSIAEALAEPQALARDLVLHVDHPEWGEIQQVRTAARVGTLRSQHDPAPGLGADTEHVLRSICGYTEAQVCEVLDSQATPPAQ